jgi:hypothetical protein
MKDKEEIERIMDNINSTFNIAIAIEEVYKVWKL